MADPARRSATNKVGGITLSEIEDAAPSVDSGVTKPPTIAPDEAPDANMSAQLRNAAAGALRRGSLIVVWIAIFITFGALMPDKFLTSGTLQTIFGSQQALVFIAMGALCAFAVGEFDFSVASVAGLSATVVSVLVSNQHMSVWLASIVAVAVAVGVGAFNALLIIRIGINPIVTTLGVATLLTGISSRLSDGGIVSLNSPGLHKISSVDVLGLPINFFYGLLVAIIFTYIMSRTP